MMMFKIINLLMNRNYVFKKYFTHIVIKIHDGNNSINSCVISTNN